MSATAPKGRALAAKLPNTMRRDPGDSGSVTFGFVDLPARGEAPLVTQTVAFQPGRLGCAERDLMVELGDNLHISLTGWYTDKVSLNDRQVIFLRNFLNRYTDPSRAE